MVVKEFSFDDSMYYDTLTVIEKRVDFLVIGFSNLNKKDKAVYMALTTKYISLIDENYRTTQIDLSKIGKITQPYETQICIEYQSVEGKQRMTLNVDEGKLNARQIVEELHLQIGLIIARS